MFPIITWLCSLVRVAREKILSVLGDGEPRTSKQVIHETGLSGSSVWNVLHRCWRSGLVLRSEKPVRVSNRVFRGRAGFTRNVRSYYFYVLRPEGVDSLRIAGQLFVEYADEYLDQRGARKESKARMVLSFLKENGGQAWYSKEVAEALRERGVKPFDVMGNVRRFEKKGLVYVRGYRSDMGETPFREGYLLTWIEQGKPREEAIREAVQRTDGKLVEKGSTNPVIERIHFVCDQIMASSLRRELSSFDFLLNKLGCTKHKAEYAIERSLQLYPDMKKIKLFDRYRYYYHSSMSPEDLHAAVSMKENYLRKKKGRDNRIGHNWEAVVGWFVDKFTVGVKFRTQKHRTPGMDPRRITIHLIKSVAGRRRNAEVDRVWTVTPGVFTQPVTYVLECKWGLIRKSDVDGFFDVLRWSKEFGTDTERGRSIKQGVVGIFAGNTFNPEERVYLNEEEVSLAAYANRMNMQLLKAVDFNKKLRERGCASQITVQKVCRLARGEREVRETLDAVWASPKGGGDVLRRLAEKNEALYEFERMLEEK